jgi:hypothetical protein
MTTGASTTATTSTNSGAPSFASAKNCRDLVALGRKFSEAFKTTANGSANLSNVADAYKSLASAAPAEIRSDFQTFANAFSDYAKALDKSGFKPGKTPTASQIAAITAASKEFSSPKLLTAERHLTAWGQQNCAGVTTTTG